MKVKNLKRAKLVVDIGIFICLVVLFSSLFSLAAADDTGKSEKSGCVDSSVGTYLNRNFDDAGSISQAITISMRIAVAHKDRYWTYYKIPYSRVALKGGVDWDDDVPGCAGDVFTIGSSAGGGGTYVGSGEVYVSKYKDDGSYYVVWEFYFTDWNTDFVRGIGSDTTVYLTTDWPIIKSYYQYAYQTNTGTQEAADRALYGICMWIPGGRMFGSHTGSVCSYRANCKNCYEIDNNAVNKTVKVIRGGSQFDDYSVDSSLIIYDTTGKIWESSVQDSNDTFVLLPKPSKYIINFSDCDTEKVIWDDLGSAGSEGDLYGYVFDAKDGYVISGASVLLDGSGATSDDGGYYTYSSVYPGVYDFNVSKTGYQDFDTVLDISGERRYDAPLIKNETVNSGTCTVAGVVLDITTKEPLDNALVVIENTSYDSYVYTNEMGYFVFYDLSNTTYTLTGTKEGYYKSQLDISLADLDTAYYYQLELVSTDDVPEPTPTPTSTSGDERPVVDGIIMIFDLFGLGEYVGFILAFLVIAALGFVFGCGCGGNPFGFLIGGFFGYVIDVAIGWLPIWTVAVVICVVVFYLVKLVSKE